MSVAEVAPLARAPLAAIVAPGSKSITNRALILAALADGEVTLDGALWSDDTRYMCEALERLGFDVAVAPDPREAANRTITVRGLGGAIPNGGTVDRPLELYVGNAGTAARFLTALVTLGRGVYRIAGTPRMAERPQGPLIAGLRQMGFRIDSPNDRLPAVVHGGESWAATCRVSARESSQFASALLLVGRVRGWAVEVIDADREEVPYVEMTRRVIEAFPHAGGRFLVEPDASSGSYFWGAAWLLAEDRGPGWLQHARVRVTGWPQANWQVDERFPDYLPLPVRVSRDHDLGDSIMTAIVLAPFAAEPVTFTDLGRLRLQECERVAALRDGLTRLGAAVTEEGDSLVISPSRLHGGEVETYDDHRMAMCFGMLGLTVPGVRIHGAECVAKTFPNFWEKFAEQPPRGLGATVRWD